MKYKLKDLITPTEPVDEQDTACGLLAATLSVYVVTLCNDGSVLFTYKGKDIKCATLQDVVEFVIEQINKG